MTRINKQDKQEIAKQLLKGTPVKDLVRVSQQGTGKIGQYNRGTVYAVKKKVARLEKLNWLFQEFKRKAEELIYDNL